MTNFVSTAAPFAETLTVALAVVGLASLTAACGLKTENGRQMAANGGLAVLSLAMIALFAAAARHWTFV